MQKPMMVIKSNKSNKANKSKKENKANIGNKAGTSNTTGKHMKPSKKGTNPILMLFEYNSFTLKIISMFMLAIGTTGISILQNGDV